MNHKNQTARLKRIARLKRKYDGADFELFRRQVLEETVAMNKMFCSASYFEQHLYRMIITAFGALLIIALIFIK
ncbi:MAG: hypothetical protein HWE10_01260 [Gammaproteobacteria bacterium]|nr:hypothetical protein [Gammaproteobacteria bacterium]